MKTLFNLFLVFVITLAQVIGQESNEIRTDQHTYYRTVEIEDVDIFYREAGPKNAPTILLLHGYPTSSYMYRNLIRDLSDSYHLIAPDYPGFGQSGQPSPTEFEYSFDHFAVIIAKLLDKLDINQYSIYLMDYGAPVGFRLASKHPEQVQSLIVQNGNAYEEGLGEFWVPIKKFWNDNSPENAKPLMEFNGLNGLIWQYTFGMQDSTKVSPDTWTIDMQHISRPGNAEVQLALFYDYRTNVPLYPSWQAYFREYQPPTLIVWGKNDFIFPAKGAYPYKKDLKNIEFHLLNTGHFALEEEGDVIANYIRNFLHQNQIK